MQLGVIDCKSRFSDWLEIGDLLRINQLFGFEFPIVDLAVAVSSTSFSDCVEGAGFPRDRIKLIRCHISSFSNSPSTKVAAGIGEPSIP